MPIRLRALAVPVFGLLLAIPVRAQDNRAPPAGPGRIIPASPSVSINGQPAARQGDIGGGSVIQDGSHNVFINGKPAATVGSQSECGGAIVTGSPSVFINGRPVATGGSLTTRCPR